MSGHGVSSGGGAVDSVNTQIGAVVLDAGDLDTAVAPGPTVEDTLAALVAALAALPVDAVITLTPTQLKVTNPVLLAGVPGFVIVPEGPVLAVLDYGGTPYGNVNDTVIKYQTIGALIYDLGAEFMAAAGDEQVVAFPGFATGSAIVSDILAGKGLIVADGGGQMTDGNSPVTFSFRYSLRAVV